MQVMKLVSGALTLTATGAAFAGPSIPLGEPLGFALGTALGDALGATLGIPLGDVSLAGSSVLLLGAACLAFGTYLARRKRQG